MFVQVSVFLLAFGTYYGYSFDCPNVDGPNSVYFPDRRNCSRFWQCSNGVAYQQSCPAGLYFNRKLNVCDWPRNVNCRPVPCSKRSDLCPRVNGLNSVYIPDPDCTKFCQCSNGKAYRLSCPTPLFFNPVLDVCDYPDRAGCAGNTTSYF